MWLHAPSANYLPLNLLKHMGLGVTFAQETFVDITCSFDLTFLPPLRIEQMFPTFQKLPSSLAASLPPSLPQLVGDSCAGRSLLLPLS